MRDYMEDKNALVNEKFTVTSDKKMNEEFLSEK